MEKYIITFYFNGKETSIEDAFNEEGIKTLEIAINNGKHIKFINKNTTTIINTAKYELIEIKKVLENDK